MAERTGSRKDVANIKRKRYDCSFQIKWLSMPEYMKWIKAVHNNSGVTYCRYCDKKFRLVLVASVMFIVTPILPTTKVEQYALRHSEMLQYDSAESSI